MQEITHPGNTQKNKIPVMDFDLDSLDFKPVTKGLGFHQDKVSETKNRSYIKQNLRKKTERSQRNYPSMDINHEVRIEINEPIKKDVIVKSNKKVKTAKMGVQGTAFVFDLFIISTFQVLLNYSFLKIAGLSNLPLFLEITWMEQLLFFSFLFLFYFTLLDLVATPGKRIFSMRLKSTVDKSVSIDQTLIRSMVTLLSVFTALMPLLFDFQGKLSDTKVVEDV